MRKTPSSPLVKTELRHHCLRTCRNSSAVWQRRGVPVKCDRLTGGSPSRAAAWRTPQDPFAEVWPVLLSWLEEKPDLEAKEMLKRLQATSYGNFSASQLRTLQRRVR